MSKIYVVGMGPGLVEHMTPKAKQALADCDIIVGYKVYIDLLKEQFPTKEMRKSGMRSEIDRCKDVLALALAGKKVGLVSSGDSGVYGMAGLMYEIVADQPVEVVIVPGITAANSAAAVLGAPLMHDYATISLSDLLTPLDAIYRRVDAAAAADFVICLYNPKSKGRPKYIDEARDIVLKYRTPDTPVGIVRNAGRSNQTYDITTLQAMLDCKINMFATVIIGNSKTYVKHGKMITPRGYENKGIL